jgi:hypothetical protein
MRLEVGDKIYCKGVIGDGLTLSKEYVVTNTRPKSRWNGDDICILDDDGQNWWFGQIGETECWTNWFISEKEFIREEKLNDLLKSNKIKL